MSRTLEVFEHGKLPVSDVGDGLRPHELEALLAFNDAHGGQYFEAGHRHLRTKSFVGYVEVDDLSIEILPKADRGGDADAHVWRTGLLEMLHVAMGMKLAPLPEAGQRMTRPRLLDLIARAFVDELEPLFREGLAKGYRTTRSNGAVFRGRLAMSEHLRDNVARADRFFVEYQTFDHDIAANQVLAAALDLLSWCALSPGTACAVDAALSRFPELSLAGVTAGTCDRVRLGRATQRYAQALVYARMVLAQRGPQLRHGRERVFALLFDMNQLWERYIAALLRRVAPPGLEISTQERCDFWLPELRETKRVKPDIVVRDAGGNTLLVIDTKWKVPGQGLPSDDDLKQMFVYNELLGSARSMLLYPRTAISSDAGGAFAARPHRCEQVHVGVFEPPMRWSTAAVKQGLAELLVAVT